MAECTIVRSPASQTSMRRVSAGNPAGAPSVAVSGPLPVVQVRMGPGGPQPQGPSPGGLPVVQVRMGADGPKAQGGGYQVRPAAIRPRPVATPTTIPPLQQYAGLTDDHLLLLRHLATKHIESLQPGDAEGNALAAEVGPAIDALLTARAALAEAEPAPIPTVVVNAGTSPAVPGSPRRFPGRSDRAGGQERGGPLPIINVRMDAGQPVPADPFVTDGQ